MVQNFDGGNIWGIPINSPYSSFTLSNNPSNILQEVQLSV